ncbi:hypothetical protein ABE547_14200 [Dorea sp. YH-dor226]|uniref:hypothetical protein n=1 Tax=Dorea sp. YH-dor226 TaxID=3151119 RepID=UPI0032421B52
MQKQQTRMRRLKKDAADGGESEKQIVFHEPLTHQRMKSIAQKELCPDDCGWKR